MPWTEITRAQYRRDGLRFSSDMTDAEWKVIARRLPPRRRWVGHAEPICAKWSKQSATCWPPAVSGVLCRATFRRAPRYRAISTHGATPVCGAESSTAWCGGHAGPWRKPTPTAAVIDSQRCIDPKWRSARLRCRKTRAWTQAPHCYRYQWSAARRAGASGQHPGCPRCSPATGALAGDVPQASPRLCRSRLPRRSIGSGLGALWALDHRNRRAASRRQRLPALAPTMGRRAHLCLARPLPPSCQGLRDLYRQRNRVAPRRPTPAPHPPSRKAPLTRLAF